LYTAVIFVNPNDNGKMRDELGGDVLKDGPSLHFASSVQDLPLEAEQFEV